MKTRKIPKGAIKVMLPDVQQPDDYSCGAGVFMSIASYFGVGPEELETIKLRLGTNPEHGTYYREIEKYANELGLKARVRTNMTRRQLKRLLDRGVPVIVSMQAYADDESVYADPEHNKDGHYIAAIGYDDEDVFYFMDPSIAGQRGFLPWDELKRRWHEDEGWSEPEIHQRLAIVIKPGKGMRGSSYRARRIA